MKKIPFFLIILSVFSCVNKVTPIKGTYPEGLNVVTPASYDEVWDKAVKYFKDNNIAINHSDKKNGYIESETVNVPWSRESKHKKPLKSDAHVAVIKIYDGGANTVRNYRVVTAKYRVTVTKTGDNIMVFPIINQIKVNGEEYYTDMKVNNPNRKTYPFGKSTGVFENSFIEAVK